ncbi:hypothetical protein Cgig2_001149 [Carnegiea gigantea]|uniref:Retrotransposon gag domain-containing protein n=1 Tax=Carnegiea gigantea TaxID=171969 RepID=A0A9Q1QBL3_9CARY|nr:hypothetical protein Cgig2_001149 [Carnegiea gigantea]
MLHWPPPMAAPPRPPNARKYCEFYEQSGHTTTECRELKNALHELADKGQIDWFLKRWPRFLQQEQTPASPPPRDEECSTDVVATIAGGYEAKIGINKTGGQGLHVGLSVILALFLLGRTGLSFQGLVASSLAVSPSDEGGINSTSLGSRPSIAARSCSSTKHRRGRRSGLAGSPAPWPRLRQPQLSSTGAAAPSFRFRGPLDLPAASHSISDIEKRVPPATGTLQRPLPVWRRHQPCPSPPRRPLGVPEPQGPPDEREPNACVRLDKAGRRPWVSEETPLAPGVAAPLPWEGVGCACLAGVCSPDDKLPDW